MKRTALKRKKGLRARRRPARWQLEDLPRQMFREAARDQRKFCQCKTPRRAHAHHVLYEQHAKDEGANPHDPRNAMLVCGHCHFQHHQGAGRIPESALPASALDFLVEVLGVDRTRAYLGRYYG